MSIEQQIQACEDHITRLEHMKRNMVTSGFNTDQSIDDRIFNLEMSRINKDLDDYYQQVSILKIRYMMGF